MNSRKALGSMKPDTMIEPSFWILFILITALMNRQGQLKEKKG
jgi:hypothetical protein